MSENDIRAWRESAAKPHELPADRLLRRLVKRTYAYGWSAQKNGVESEHAQNLHRLVEADRDELLRRLR